MSVKNLRCLFRYSLGELRSPTGYSGETVNNLSTKEIRRQLLQERLAERRERGNRGPGLVERMRASLAEARRRAVEFVRSTRNKLDDAALETWLSIVDPEVRQLTLEALKEETANIGNQAAKKTQEAVRKLASVATFTGRAVVGSAMFAGGAVASGAMFVGEQLVDKGRQVVEGTREAAKALNREFQDRVLGPAQTRLREMQASAQARVDSLVDFYRLDRAKSQDFWAGLAERGAAGLTELVSKLQEYAANQRGRAEALRQKVENSRATRAAIANVASSNTTSS